MVGVLKMMVEAGKSYWMVEIYIDINNPELFEFVKDTLRKANYSFEYQYNDDREILVSFIVYDNEFDYELLMLDVMSTLNEVAGLGYGGIRYFDNKCSVYAGFCYIYETFLSMLRKHRKVRRDVIDRYIQIDYTGIEYMDDEKTINWE